MAAKDWYWKFVVNDWLTDEAVAITSLAAQGLWFRCLCLMFKNTRRGYLHHIGKPMSAAHLAHLTHVPTDEVSRLLQELENAGVFSRTEDGTIFNRRMVRDEKSRKKAIEWGKQGGNPRLKGGVNPPVTSSITSNSNSPEGLGVQGEGKRKRFVKPTVEEVAAYCLARGNSVDPQAWLDHYQANGWKVGPNPMQDWKASVRTWEKTSKSAVRGGSSGKQSVSDKNSDSAAIVREVIHARQARQSQGVFRLTSDADESGGDAGVA